jgi:hypothetical protein
MTYKIESDGYNGAITFLINESGARIEIHDRASSTKFLYIELDVQQLAEMLGRRSHTPCNIETRGLDRIGKKMLMNTLEFPMPKADYQKRKEVAVKEAKKCCPEGWYPDEYFGSHGSFFTKDGKDYARTTIRKWEQQ